MLSGFDLFRAQDAGVLAAHCRTPMLPLRSMPGFAIGRFLRMPLIPPRFPLAAAFIAAAKLAR